MGLAGGASIHGAIHKVKDGSTVRVQATLDQGNNIHLGVGISERFFQDTTMGYAHRTRNYVTTASVESNLTRLGLTECFFLT